MFSGKQFSDSANYLHTDAASKESTIRVSVSHNDCGVHWTVPITITSKACLCSSLSFCYILILSIISFICTRVTQNSGKLYTIRHQYENLLNEDGSWCLTQATMLLSSVTGQRDDWLIKL